MEISVKVGACVHACMHACVCVCSGTRRMPKSTGWLLITWPWRLWSKQPWREWKRSLYLIRNFNISFYAMPHYSSSITRSQARAHKHIHIDRHAYTLSALANYQWSKALAKISFSVFCQMVMSNRWFNKWHEFESLWYYTQCCEKVGFCCCCFFLRIYHTSMSQIIKPISIFI